MTLFKALRILALREVSRQTEEYQLREMYRWYARTYGLTPLEAQELPLLHVLEEYFEHEYGQLSAEELEEEKRKLLETDEEREARINQEHGIKVSEAEFAAMTKKMAEEQAKQAKPLDSVKLPVERVPAPMPEVSLDTGVPKRPEKLAPDITVKFASEDEFSRLLEEDLAPGDEPGGNLKR